MFKVKAWIFTPQILICYVLLCAILTIVSFKPAPNTHVERDTDGVLRTYSNPNAEAEVGRQDDEYYDTHPLTYRDMKEYQLEIVDEHYAILYDYNRIVGVLPLDNKCNLTNLILKDNQ